MSFRPVHASSRHAFLGIMSWVSMIVVDVLHKWRHLVHSSDQFINRITAVAINGDDIFMHVDLQDFFMTGDRAFLVHHTSLLVPRKYRVVFRLALTFLLDNQYVTSRLFPGHLWKVQSGSGMGLRSSADVSNAAFLHAVELCGLAILTSSARERWGIKSYTRYADNLLFVLEPDFDKIRSLKRHLEGCMKPYTGVLEEASHVGITFLDVNLVKDDQWRRTGVISFFPFMKPTCLQHVLSVNSAHNSSTHGAWMKAFLQRLRKHSSSLVWYRTMQAHTLSKLRRAGIDHAIVSAVEVSSNFTYPVCVPSCLLSVIPASVRPSFWIKLPFHPVWCACVNRALRQFCADPGHAHSLKSLFGSQTHSIRAAWILRMPALASIVSKI